MSGLYNRHKGLTHYDYITGKGVNTLRLYNTQERLIH